MDDQSKPAVFIYQCRCGTTHQTSVTGTPVGWGWLGSELVCNDCLATRDALVKAEKPPRRASTSAPRAGAEASTIRLRSGTYLDLADPDCSKIAPIDIASGLRQLRFAGQTPRPYTIAQHSLLVLRLVEPVAAQISRESGMAMCRCALLHDAAEAFIHDVTRPLKALLPDYRAIEQLFEDRLNTHLGVVWNKPRREIIKRADLQALAIERRELFGCRDPWPVLEGIENENLLRISLGRVWPAEEAEERFLEAFAALAPQQERIAA